MGFFSFKVDFCITVKKACVTALNRLRNDALNTFYLWLYSVIHLVNSEIGNTLPPTLSD